MVTVARRIILIADRLTPTYRAVGNGENSRKKLQNVVADSRAPSRCGVLPSLRDATSSHAARHRFLGIGPGALLLLRYRFEKKEILQHSLGFYPSPFLEEFQNNPEIYLEDAVYAEVIARNIVPFPIRFDFDCRSKVVVPCKHPKSHLTLGQYENCRIPVTSPLTPICFFAFVLRNFYNTAFVEFCQALPIFTECFEDSIHEEERQLVHMQIPLALT